MNFSRIFHSETKFAVSSLMMFALVAIITSFFAAPTHSRARFDLEKVSESKTQVAVPYLSAAVHRSGSYAATVSNQGILGSGFIISNGPGVEFPQGSGIDYLFAGALWVGGIIGSDTLVSVGADGWNSVYEMWPDDINSNTATVGVPFICDVADQEHLAMYFDTLVSGVNWDPTDSRPHHPLGLKITQTSRSWSEPPFDDFLILEFLIQNIGVQLIEDVWVGVYMDADVLHPSGQSGFKDDIAGFRSDNNIAWIADNDGHEVISSTWQPEDPRGAIGVMFLDFWPPPSNPRPNFNWWVSNGNAALDFGPRLKGTTEDPFRDFGGFRGTPEGDKNKYYIMRHTEIDYDQLFSAVDLTNQGWLAPFINASDVADGFDTRFVISQGGNDLAPGDTMRVVVAMVLGADLHVNPDDFATLFDPLNPESYHNSLDFSDLIANANAAESLYNSGYNTPVYSPPPTPELVDKFAASPVMTWCYSANSFVVGYDVYLKEIPPELVFCDVEPINALSFAPEDQINGAPVTVDSFELSGLTDGKWYQAAVAIHPPQGRDPEISEAVVFHYGVPTSPDIMQDSILAPGSPFVTFDWSDDNSDIEHFNIYRMDDYTRDLLFGKLSKFSEPHWKSSGLTYTSIECEPEFLACDSTGGNNASFQNVCAYRLEPHATVPGYLDVFAESIDSAAKFHYFVTAVDNAGNESIGSKLITAFTKPIETKPLAVYL